MVLIQINKVADSGALNEWRLWIENGGRSYRSVRTDMVCEGRYVMGMSRISQFAVAVAVGAALVALPVAGTAPVKSTSPFSYDFYADGVCPFSIHILAQGELTFILHERSDNVHYLEQDTYIANGKTLVGLPYTYNVQEHWDSNGNFLSGVAEGVVVRVPLPDGSMFFGAGRVNFANHPGQFYYVVPDVGRSGNVEAFCAALAP